MKALREKTQDELIYLHAVQAGVPDLSEAIVKAVKPDVRLFHRLLAGVWMVFVGVC